MFVIDAFEFVFSATVSVVVETLMEMGWINVVDILSNFMFMSFAVYIIFHTKSLKTKLIQLFIALAFMVETVIDTYNAYLIQHNIPSNGMWGAIVSLFSLIATTYFVYLYLEQRKVQSKHSIPG